MTKDELYRFYLSCHFSEDFALRMVKKAEDLAKQQAIAFMNWTLTSECDTYNCTDEDQWTNIYTQENITTEQLYNQFIEQQNKEQ